MLRLRTVLLILPFFVRIIISLTVEDLSLRPSILSRQVTEVIEFASRRQTSTRNTLRIISSSLGEKQDDDDGIISLFEPTFSDLPVIRVSRNQSVSILAPHTRKKHAVDRYDLFAFITVAVIRSSVDISDHNDRIRHSIDPRRDFLIFAVGSGDENLMRSLRTLSGLRLKTIVNSDGNLKSLYPQSTRIFALLH
jgi:hypothetical protein